MNLLETLQKLLKEVACMTTQLLFSLQITEAPHGDLTGKKMVSLTVKVDNKLSRRPGQDFTLKLQKKLDDISGLKCFLIPLSFLRNEGCNYPFKGGKDTFWEGGVRGVGFVHSNLIRNKGCVSYDLIDVTDWLPTFYHLAGGDVSVIQERIDGMNVWETISYGKKSPRTEV